MNSFDFAKFGDMRQKIVLDLGAGSGRHSVEALLAGAVVIAFELDVMALTELKENVMTAADYVGQDRSEILGRLHLISGDARALPFLADSFDVVILAEVLEHIVEDGLVISQAERVTKCGGHMGVAVPRAFPELINWSLSKRYHAVSGGHIRIYRRSTLIRRLEYGSLKVEAWTHKHGLHSPYWWLKCLVGLEKNDSRIVIAAHNALVRQMMHEVPVLDRLDKALNPIIGKSLIIYVRKTTYR